MLQRVQSKQELDEEVKTSVAAGHLCWLYVRMMMIEEIKCVRKEEDCVSNEKSSLTNDMLTSSSTGLRKRNHINFTFHFAIKSWISN